MSQRISLKKAERQAFTLAMFQDGLWDIFLGCTLILLSLYPMFRSALGLAPNLLLFFLVMGILLVGFYLARRFIALPRAGLVKLGPARKATLRKLRIITLVLVLATSLFVVLVITGAIELPLSGAFPDWIGKFGVDILFAAIIIGLFSFIAYALGVPRIFLYGWLFGVGALWSTILSANNGLTFQLPLTIAGGTIVVVGVVLFIRFLRVYRLPVEGQPAEEVYGGNH